MTLKVLFLYFSAEDAVEKQPTSSDSSAPASSVCLDGNGHPVKKHEVVMLLKFTEQLHFLNLLSKKLEEFICN